MDIVTNENSGDGEFTGFLIKSSTRFVMLHVVDDWHANGVQIFPISRIASVTPCDNKIERQTILQWNNFASAAKYIGINLESFESIFKSFQGKNEVVLIEDFESTEIGKITNYTDCLLTLKGIDGSGQWLDEEVVRPYSDIWYVIYDDEYSRVLGNYLNGKEEVMQDKEKTHSGPSRG